MPHSICCAFKFSVNSNAAAPNNRKSTCISAKICYTKGMADQRRLYMDIINAILDLIEVIFDIFIPDNHASKVESNLSELALRESLDEATIKEGI